MSDDAPLATLRPSVAAIPGLTLLILFGSRARGDSQPASDWDFGYIASPEFDPDRLQEEFDRQLNKGSLLSVPAKLRYWDLYRDRCRDMVKDPETSFRELFGEEFAKAYEDQLKRLKVKIARDSEKDRR